MQASEMLLRSPRSFWRINLYVDEMMARREAERRGLPVIGTIGVLSEAAGEGLIDLRECLQRLRETSFHISPAILAQLLNEEL
jgi:predicted nucleic acid-binding protein